MSFASKLQEIRVQNNISQEGLAEMLGVSRQSVSKWERGKGYPEIDKLICISERFGVSLDELLKDKKDASGNPRRTINLTKDTKESVRVEYPENSASGEIWPERKPYAEAEEVNKNFFNGEVVSERAGIAQYTNYSYSAPDSSTAGKTVKRRGILHRIRNRIRKRRRIILPVCFIISLCSFASLFATLHDERVKNVYLSNAVYEEMPAGERYSDYWLEEEHPMRYMVDESTGTRYVFDAESNDGIVTDLAGTDISQCVKVTEISTGDVYYCEPYYSDSCVTIISEKNICYVIPYYIVREYVDAESQKDFTAYQDIYSNSWYFVPDWIISNADEGLDGNIIVKKDNSEAGGAPDEEAPDAENEKPDENS